MSLSSANCLNGTACSFLNCHAFMLVCLQLTKITFSVSQQIIKKKIMSQKLQFSDHSTFSLGFLTFFFSFFTSPSLSSCCSGLLFCDGLSAALFSCSWTCFTTEGELVLPVTTCCGATAAVGTVENNKSKMCWHTGNICLSLGQTVTSTILNYWSHLWVRAQFWYLPSSKKMGHGHYAPTNEAMDHFYEELKAVFGNLPCKDRMLRMKWKTWMLRLVQTTLAEQR